METIKRCKNCGTDNAYERKSCSSCGRSFATLHENGGSKFSYVNIDDPEALVEIAQASPYESSTLPNVLRNLGLVMITVGIIYSVFLLIVSPTLEGLFIALIPSIIAIIANFAWRALAQILDNSEQNLKNSNKLLEIVEKQIQK